MPLWLFDAILVGFVRLVVSGVILRLRHRCNSKRKELNTEGENRWKNETKRNCRKRKRRTLIQREMKIRLS